MMNLFWVSEIKSIGTSSFSDYKIIPSCFFMYHLTLFKSTEKQMHF